MTKSIKIFIFILLSALGQNAYSFGLGLVGSNPEGISFKTNPRSATAFDGAFGWKRSENYSSFSLTGDCLFQKHKYFHYGFGLQITSTSDDNSDDDGTDFALRAPMGIRKFFRRARIEIFAELAAYINTDFNLNVNQALGIRYYF